MKAQTERLWRVWWLWGLPIAALTLGLAILAELARLAGYHGCGNALDVLRVAVYWFWLRRAWRCSLNVDHRFWTPLARAALVTGLVAHALA